MFCKSPASANDLADKLICQNVYGIFEQNAGIVEWIRNNYHPEWILA